MPNDGLARLQRRLAAIPKRARAAVRPALEKSGEEMVAMARRLAPDDPETIGADLKASIRHHPGSHELQHIVRAGGAMTTRPSAAGDYDYALGVEFGTSKMSAQPFFWTSYRLLRKRIRSRTKRAVSRAVKEAFRGK